ncbi:sulfatase-like hydrolase/transferase, partial [Vibrio parahaemolyticus]
AGKVLDTLEKNGDLERTLVIITGDHGQEMNDNRLNFWGHNSNFTNAQVRVPFAIFGPGIDNKAMYWKANQFSSHEDVAPTIMQQYLGVDN